MSDIITIFNSITSKAMPELDKLKSLVDDNFLKFRLFYDMIGDISLKNIHSIDYLQNDDVSEFYIKLSNNSYMNKLKSSIKKNSSYKFNINLVENGSELVVRISLSSEYESEDDIIYGN